MKIVPVFTERVKITAADLMEALWTEDTSISSNTKGKVSTGGKNEPLKNLNKRVSALVDLYSTMIKLSR